jgi:hypothetical protein
MKPVSPARKREKHVRIKLFVKDDCPRCPEAKHACRELDGVEVYDVADIDGLAEASFHSVLSTPTVLVVDANGAEVAGWRGEAPPRSALLAVVAQ